MAKPLKIAQIADIHFGAEDPAAVDHARKCIEIEAADIVVACGDVTQRGKRTEFRAAHAFLTSLGTPVLSVPGNHDVPLLNVAKRVGAPFERYQAFLGHFPRHCEIGGEKFVGLNSARGWQARRNWAEGSIQIEELLSLLDQHAPSVLVAHHPFIQPPEVQLKVRTRRGAAAADIIARSGVKILLTGHVHEPVAFKIGGDDCAQTLSVSCGTLSSRLRRTPPSFNFIEMEPSMVKVRTVTLKDDAAAERVEIFDL